MTTTLEAPVVAIDGFSEDTLEIPDQDPITAAEALAALVAAFGVRDGLVSSGYVANLPAPQGGLLIAAVHTAPSGFRRDVELVVDGNRRPMEERAIRWFGAHAVAFDPREYERRKSVV